MSNQHKPKSAGKEGLLFRCLRTIMLTAIVSGMIALLAPVVLAITIRIAEVQNDVAFISGRKAVANSTIWWDGQKVTTATQKGNFSFEGEVPAECVGTLRDDLSVIDVALDDCIPDSGGEIIPEMPLIAEQLSAHYGDSVRAVGFAKNGEGAAMVISGGEDEHLRSWDLGLNEINVQVLDHTIYDLETSDDGGIVVTGEGGWNGGTDSDTLKIWDVDGFWAGTRAPIGYVYCVAVSPDNSWTVASGFYGDIVVYNTDDLELYATRATKKKRTKALAFSPDGTILASTSTAGRIQLWSFPKDECIPGACELELLPVTLVHSGSWYFPIAFNPIEMSETIEFISGTDSGGIKVWSIGNLASSTPSDSYIFVESGPVYSLAWSPNGNMIAAGGSGDITVYDAVTLEILFQNRNAHDSRVNDVAFSADSTVLASVGDDGGVKLWRLDEPTEF